MSRNRDAGRRERASDVFPPDRTEVELGALGFRLHRRTSRETLGGQAVCRPTARRIATRETARPPDRPTASVKARNIGPRKVGGDDRAVVLTRAGPAHRAPLTKPHTVAPPRPSRDEPADLPAVLRYRKPRTGCCEQLNRAVPQHRAHVRARHAHVRRARTRCAARRPGPRRSCGHCDVRDALQPAPARVSSSAGSVPRQL